MGKNKIGITIRSSNGGEITVARDSNPDDPDYIHFMAAPGNAYGVLPNSPQLRMFLHRALARLEKDAVRRKLKRKGTKKNA